MKANKSNQNRKNRTKRTPRDSSAPVHLYRDIGDQKFITRILRSSGVVSSNGGGVILMVTFQSSGVATSPDWTNFSQEYQQFRVRSIRLKLEPCYPDAYQSGVASTNPAGAIYVARFWEHVPTTASNIGQESQIKVHTTCRPLTFETNYAGFPNGRLMADTSVGITAANNYGIGLVSIPNSPLIGATSAYFTFVVEWDVEFQGPR